MLHPYELKTKWKLSWYELSEALGRDRRALIKYKKTDPKDDTIWILCSALDNLWQSPDFLSRAKESGLFVPKSLQAA